MPLTSPGFMILVGWARIFLVFPITCPIQEYPWLVLRGGRICRKTRLHPSGHTTLKWRRINVDATWSRRIDVDTTSFWCCVPAGMGLSGFVNYVIILCYNVHISLTPAAPADQENSYWISADRDQTAHQVLHRDCFLEFLRPSRITPDKRGSQKKYKQCLVKKNPPYLELWPLFATIVHYRNPGVKWVA